MEDMIAKIIEQSVVSGGFIFLLYHVLHKQDKQLTAFANELSKSNESLVKIVGSMDKFNDRLEDLEEHRKQM